MYMHMNRHVGKHIKACCTKLELSDIGIYLSVNQGDYSYIHTPKRSNSRNKLCNILNEIQKYF